MKIALVSDVHANLPALEAVMAHARARGVEEFWSLGDIVGCGPFPDECARLLSDSFRYSVQGNHDVRALPYWRDRRKEKEARDPDKAAIVEWTRTNCSRKTQAYLQDLPSVMTVVVRGHKIQLTHSLSEEPSGQILPGTRLVLSGHTHGASDRRIRGIRCINPGTAGSSFDGDARAAYALLEIGEQSVDVVFERVVYDCARVGRAMKERGFPARSIRAFSAARSLDGLDRQEMAVLACELPGRAERVGVRESFDREHAFKVSELALKLFDGLCSVHGLGDRERLLLQSAAILHDSGFSRSPRAHHKIARDIILRDRTLPLTWKERVVAALVARYHRRALPDLRHRYYGVIGPARRRVVDVLGGMLRMADGMDRTHRGEVCDIKLEVFARRLEVTLFSQLPVPESERCTGQKSDLLSRALNLEILVRHKFL